MLLGDSSAENGVLAGLHTRYLKMGVPPGVFIRLLVLEKPLIFLNISFSVGHATLFGVAEPFFFFFFSFFFLV